MTWQYDLQACGTVTGAHTAATTSITVGSGEGSRFAVSPRKLVVFEASYYDNPAEAVAMGKGEIVVQTLQASDVLTVLRAQDGTTAIDMTDTNNIWFICNFVDVNMSGELLNVRSFGAVGDGVADDTDSVHLTFQTVVDGGTVWFPAGTYDLTTWPDAGRDYAKKFTILGEGTGSLIEGPATALFLDVSDEIYVHGLDFGTWLKVFEFDPITTLIDRISIEMCRFGSLDQGLVWQSPVDSGEVENFSIRDCTFKELTGTPISLTGTWDHMLIEGCFVDTAIQIGFQLGENVPADQDHWKNTKIVNNTIKAISASSGICRGINSFGIAATISGNVVEDVSGGTTSNEGIYSVTQRSTITGNKVTDVDGTALPYGIRVEGDDLGGSESSTVEGFNVVVSDNVIDMEDNVGSRGIGIRNDNIVCSGNVILGVRDMGIIAGESSQSNITVIGNRIDFGTVNTSFGQGILFSTSGDNLHAIGNNITGAHRGIQLTPITGTPTDCSIVSNIIGAANVGVRILASVVLTGIRIFSNHIYGATTGVSMGGGSSADIVQLAWNTFRSVTTDVSFGNVPTNMIRIDQNLNTLELRNRLEIITGSATTDGFKFKAGTAIAEMTQTKGFEVTAGGLTVVAGGVTVTAGGVTVTAGGLDVDGGDLLLETGVGVYTGTGAPGSGLGADGSIFLRTDGGPGPGSSFYYKQEGSWNAVA